MKVKVCGMTQADNLRNVLVANPDFVGFIFYDKSSRNVNNTEVLNQEITGVKKVGVFVNEGIEEVIQKVGDYQLDYVQLHGDESADYCKGLKSSQIKIVKAFSISSGFDFGQLSPYQPYVEHFLFDTKGQYRGGNGAKFDWSILQQYQLETPFFLSGGIELQDAEGIKSVSHPQLYAVDINSGFELYPGVKNADSISEFIKEIKA